MKVYALFSGEYSDTTLWGVFTTREAAQRCIDDATARFRSGKGGLYAQQLCDEPYIDEHDSDLTWEEINKLFNRRWTRAGYEAAGVPYPGDDD